MGGDSDKIIGDKMIKTGGEMCMSVGWRVSGVGGIVGLEWSQTFQPHRHDVRRGAPFISSFRVFGVFRG